MTRWPLVGRNLGPSSSPTASRHAWNFTQAIYEHEVPVAELRAEYKRKTAAIGYPDFRP